MPAFNFALYLLPPNQPFLNTPWTNISDGDKVAYAEVYKIYYRKFFNYGRKFTADIPLLEDVLQEVLISVWTNRQSLRAISSPPTYYYTAFRNALFKKLKEVHLSIDETVEQEYEFSADTILIRQEADNELKEKLQAALDTLTSRQREAIFLRFYEGLSYEEVSGILGISTKATYKIMARALLHLKENLHLSYAVAILLLKPSLASLLKP
jgi:RNA polymerase sigma factor (sigma-70 family)